MLDYEGRGLLLSCFQIMFDTVESEYLKAKEVYSLLIEIKQISLAQQVADGYAKSFLLAAASKFESEIKKLVLDWIKNRTGNCPNVEAFIQISILDRGYAKLFSWNDGGKGVNTFLKLFGDEFCACAKAQIKDDVNVESGACAFIEIGQQRNKLVHNDFSSFNVIFTIDESYKKYQNAIIFISFLRSCLIQNDDGDKISHVAP